MDIEKTKQIKLIARKLLALENTINSVLNNSNAIGFSQYSSYKQMALIYNDIVAEFKEYQSKRQIMTST
jgi:ABC-type phosphate transport system substrate-binding protein